MTFGECIFLAVFVWIVGWIAGGVSARRTHQEWIDEVLDSILEADRVPRESEEEEQKERVDEPFGADDWTTFRSADGRTWIDDSEHGLTCLNDLSALYYYRNSDRTELFVGGGKVVTYNGNVVPEIRAAMAETTPQAAVEEEKAP